ncbi:helix-turn-helix domain-containing protein [Haloplanus aerogenes]|nr:helix-turn-helix domain-containing protein [Haloplanus aerogenes]AZH26473.1 transcriptional regulator [Haloplanus aerogenes]
MKEIEFAIRYEPGADKLMDVFHENPSLSCRSSACYSNETAMWRIDHVRGSEAAVEAFAEVFLDEDRCNECLDRPTCDSSREYHVLDRTPESRTIYTYRREVHRCHSLPYFVLDHVGDGVVFESRRTQGEYRWKILYPGNEPVGELFDTIDRILRQGLSLELSHLRQSGNWNADTRTAFQLSHEQWDILSHAVEEGYYARPREVTVAELGEQLGLPRSTVQYRLRSAEDLIVTEFVRNTL